MSPRISQPARAAAAGLGGAPAGHKAAQAHGDDGRLAAASNHDVGVTVADVVGGCTQQAERDVGVGREMHVPHPARHASHTSHRVPVVGDLTGVPHAATRSRPTLATALHNGPLPCALPAYPKRTRSWRWRRRWRWSSWGP